MEKICATCGLNIPTTKRADATYCGPVCKSKMANSKPRPKKSAEYYLDQRRRYNSAHPLRNVLHGARKRARALGVPFTITENDLSVPEVCPILQVPLVRGKSGNSNHTPSIDRIVPSLGYTPDNVQFISQRANILKTNLTIEEVGRLYEYMGGKIHVPA